jgi:hypothetical protein
MQHRDGDANETSREFCVDSRFLRITSKTSLSTPSACFDTCTKTRDSGEPSLNTSLPSSVSTLNCKDNATQARKSDAVSKRWIFVVRSCRLVVVRCTIDILDNDNDNEYDKQTESA